MPDPQYSKISAIEDYCALEEVFLSKIAVYFG